VTRTRTSRALAGFLGVWVGICLAQPMQLHLCVMHGGLAIDSGAQSSVDASHTVVSHSAHHHSGTDHQRSPQCGCLGDCTTGNASACVVAARVAAEQPAVGRLAAPATMTSTPIVATDFILPFSNGPPGTSSFAS
jgi:hypothetical protein